MRVIAVVAGVILVAGGAQARQAAPGPLEAAVASAVADMTKLRAAMIEKKCPAEVADCDAILGKFQKWSRPMNVTHGNRTPYPGQKEYDAIMDAWVEVGAFAAKAFSEAQTKLAAHADELFQKAESAKGADKARLDGAQDQLRRDARQAEALGGWMAHWGELPPLLRALNRRRVASKMSPVTISFAATFARWMHVQYLEVNRERKPDPKMPEDPRLPGYTPEGSVAGEGTKVKGADAECIDRFFNTGLWREPAFNPRMARTALTTRNNWIWCAMVSETTDKMSASIFHWPGDGDDDIPTTFVDNDPVAKCLPQGMAVAGTFITVQFWARAPKTNELDYRMLDSAGREVETVLLTKLSAAGRAGAHGDLYRPELTFVPREALAPGEKYTVELTIVKQPYHKFSFTTKP